MRVFLERHSEGFCIVYAEGYNEGFTVTEGKPHMKSTLYFSNRRLATQYCAENGLEI
jgi:hypothetical protein